jgi:hypothetical protein
VRFSLAFYLADHRWIAAGMALAERVFEVVLRRGAAHLERG